MELNAGRDQAAARLHEMHGSQGQDAGLSEPGRSGAGITADEAGKLRDRIFPSWPPRDGHLMRTALLGGWESQFVGLGRLTAFTTDHLLRFDAALDDIALGVVFLQRHRIEVGLKLLLERSSASGYTRTHDLGDLASKTKEAMEKVGQGEEWRLFWDSNGELVSLLGEIDPAGAAFRFPVDTAAKPVSRPPLIDLVELEAEGAQFHDGVLALTDHLARREGLQIPAAELDDTAEDLAGAIAAIDGLEEGLAASDHALAGLRDHFGQPKPEPSGREAEARSGREAQIAITGGLRRDLQRCLDIVAERTGEPTTSYFPEPAPPQLPPGLRPFSPTNARADFEDLIDWTGRLHAASFRELGQALRRVHEHSRSWPEVASRQLHADLGRFLSRLYVNFGAEGAGR